MITARTGMLPAGPTLDAVLLGALEAARRPGPGRYPCCPVCGSIMTPFGDDATELLRCGECGTTLADGNHGAEVLSLVA